MRSYSELRFRDDFMFGKIMEDPELCREVIECLLQQPVGELTQVQTQKQIRYTKDGKPIRLDVYSEEDLDEEDLKRVYDTEMHNLNHKKVEDLQLPKRSRYYQGAIDVNYLGKGAPFKKLPESTVIFVCTFDPFGLGLSRYTFCEACEEKPDYKLGDGTRKIFYNCTYKGADIPEDLRMLYDYVETGKAENELTKKLDFAVYKARHNEEWGMEYLKEWQILLEKKEEGREEGQSEIIELNKWLFANDRVDDVRKATEDPAYMEKLMEEYKRSKGDGSSEKTAAMNEEEVPIAAG